MSQNESNRLSPSQIPANKHSLSNYALIALALLLFALGAIAYANPMTPIGAEPPAGWFINGSQVQNYEISVDTSIKHSGKASAHIKSIAPTTDGFGGFMQVFKADDYHGKRVRMSAWLRSQDADSVQIWLRLDGAKSMLGFDNMANRALKGTSDWKKYELILDVPITTVNFAFGAMVVGTGQGWVDDFQFEVVGQEVVSTNMLSAEQMREERETPAGAKYPLKPVNLNFEEGVLSEAEARARLAEEVANATAARKWLAANAIRLNTVEAGHGFVDMQPLKKIIGNARIVSLGEATHGAREFFQLKHRMLEFLATEQGFTIFSIEANMPEAYRLNDYVLNGKGDPATLIKGMYFWTWSTEEVLEMVQWMREFNKSGKGRVQFTGFDMQTPDVAAGLVSEFVARVDPDYTGTVRQAIDRIKNSGSGPSFGVAAAKFPVKDAAGKRVRFSGYIKTEDVRSGFAGLWWRVDGASGVLAFDNMQDRGAVGNTDWKRYEIELPVAADARNINFGAILAGTGTAWFDGLSVQLDGTPYIDKTEFELDFESPQPRGFHTGGNGYLVELDHEIFHDGKQSLRMRRSNESKGAGAKVALSAWKEIVQHLEASHEAYAKKGIATRDIEWAIQNARVVLQSMQMQTNEVSRDQSMAYNIKWILDQNPGAKIVLWAHNGHVATGNEGGFDSMGKALRQMFGNQMVVFGFAFNQGSFQAVEMPFPSKRGLRNFNVGPAPEGSLDAILASAGLNIAAIDLRRLPRQGRVAAWFKEPRATKSIGAGYGEELAANFLLKQVTPGIYDALLFVEKTTAARPLEKRASAGP
jgi:erythromycin esterase-like protein